MDSSQTSLDAHRYAKDQSEDEDSPMRLENVRDMCDFLKFGRDVIRSKIIPPWNTVLLRDDPKYAGPHVVDQLLIIGKYVVIGNGQVTSTDRQRAYLTGVTDPRTAAFLREHLNKTSGFVCTATKVRLPPTRVEWEVRCESLDEADLIVGYDEYGWRASLPIGPLAPGSVDTVAYNGSNNADVLRKLMNDDLWEVTIVDTVYARNILFDSVIYALRQSEKTSDGQH